jgi:hypothetical protein
LRAGEDDIRAAARRREIPPFWDSGVFGEREVDASEGPSLIGFGVVIGALSRVSEPPWTEDSMGRVSGVAMGGGSTGFPERVPGHGDSGAGAAGDNNGSESGDCLGDTDWPVVGLSFARDVLEMLGGDLLLCETWERPKYFESDGDKG